MGASRNSRGSGFNGFNHTFNNFDGDFSQMFNDAFNQNARGSDITIRIKLTLEEVYYGTTKYIDTDLNNLILKYLKEFMKGLS